MKRWSRLALIALPWVLVAALVWDDLRKMDIFGLDGATDAHIAAHQAFLADLGFEGCVTRPAIIAAAEGRGWAWRDRADFPYCVAPSGLQNWISVEIVPPLPFSTEDENAAIFGFDDNGCMARWTYASC